MYFLVKITRKKVLHLFLPLFVEKSYFTFNLAFDPWILPTIPTAILDFWQCQNIIVNNEFPNSWKHALLQESWFICKSLGNLRWFYRFLRSMAAILDFRTFIGQILIDFFWSFTISSRIENRWETFCYNFFGARWYINPSTTLRIGTFCSPHVWL